MEPSNDRGRLEEGFPIQFMKVEAYTPRYTVDQGVSDCKNKVDSFMNEHPLERVSTLRTALYLIPVFGWIKYLYDRYESNKLRNLAMNNKAIGDLDAAIECAHPLDKWRFQLLKSQKLLEDKSDQLSKSKDAANILANVQKVHSEIFEVSLLKSVAEFKCGKYADAYKDFTTTQRMGNTKAFESIGELKDDTLEKLRAKYPKLPSRSAPKPENLRGSDRTHVINRNKVELELAQLKESAADYEILANQNPAEPKDIRTLDQIYVAIAERYHSLDQSKEAKEWLLKLEAAPEYIDFDRALMLHQCYCGKGKAVSSPENANTPWFQGLLGPNNSKMQDYLAEASTLAMTSKTGDEFLQLAKVLQKEKNDGTMPSAKPEICYTKAMRKYEEEVLNDKTLPLPAISRIAETLVALYQRPNSKPNPEALKKVIDVLETEYRKERPLDKRVAENKILAPKLYFCYLTLSTYHDEQSKQPNLSDLTINDHLRQSKESLEEAQKLSTEYDLEFSPQHQARLKELEATIK